MKLPFRWMARRSPPEKFAVLDQRRVYILPTKSGMFFALILFLMLTGSINYSLSLGFALTFLLTAMALVSIYHTYGNLVNLRLEAGRVLPVHAGEKAVFGVYLDGSGKARKNLCLLGPEGECCIDVGETGKEAAEWSITTKKRGLLSAGRFTIQTTYPLGLFRAWSYAELTMTCIVYPKPADSVEYRYGRDAGKGGRPVSGQDDFAGLRAYRPGDSPRHVAWKSLARGGDLQIKEFEAPQGGEAVWLDWNELEGGVEERLSKLARMALDAKGSCGLRLPGKTIAQGSGETHRMRMLEALALFGS
ncbi:MAG: DUF58 domain-containing protein [Burkholderiales bacterium]|nr:DUF58 domain-containing protein [Burkholderiales bacterium]